MKPWVWVLVAPALLLVPAQAARSRRPPPKPAPAQAPAESPSACSGIAERRALAAGAAESRLQALEGFSERLNGSASKLDVDLELLRGQAKSLEDARSAAAATREGESEEFKAKAAQAKQVLSVLSEALQSSDDSALQASRVLERLAAAMGGGSASSLRPARLALLTAGRASGLKKALKEMRGSFQAVLGDAEGAEGAEAREFRSLVTRSQAELAFLESLLEERSAQRGALASALRRGQQAVAEEAARGRENGAFFGRLAVLCERSKEALSRNSTAKEATGPPPRAALPPQSPPPAFRAPNASELERLKQAAQAAANASLAALAARPQPEASLGPYGMEAVLNVPIAGFSGCSAPFLGNVYLPTANNSKQPPPPGFVVSYAHGFTEGGAFVDTAARDSLFRQLVSLGFAVVAHQSGGAFEYCDSSHDQIHMLKWAKGSRFAGRMDFRKVFLMGSSMGGRATLSNAADREVVEAHSIAGAAVFQPHCADGCGVPVVPTIFLVPAGGSVAASVDPDAYGVYAAALANKVWVQDAGSALAAARVASGDTERAAAFMQCELLGDQNACASTYGAFPNCRYGCQYCGCEACTACSPCLGASPEPPPWCDAQCSECSSCDGCQACFQCSD